MVNFRTDGSNYIEYYFNPGVGNANLKIANGGAIQMDAGPSLGAYVAGSPIKAAMAYKLDNSVSCANGTLAGTDTTCTIPTVNMMGVGCNPASLLSVFPAWVEKVMYYPARISNSELQRITS